MTSRTTSKTPAPTTRPTASELEPATAPNPKATPTSETEAAEDAPQATPPTPYPGRLVKFVSRDQFIAAAHTGEADYSPAIIARVLPTKGPDDSAFRCDLVVLDPEREGGSYVERNVVPFDGTGAGYTPLAQPVAVSVSLAALKPALSELAALAVEDYMAQREGTNAAYDEGAIRQVVADEVRKVLNAQKKDKD